MPVVPRVRPADTVIALLVSQRAFFHDLISGCRYAACGAGPRAGEQAYTDAFGDLGPFGGDTCNPDDDPGTISRTACADSLAEGAHYNCTYLNDAIIANSSATPGPGATA